MSVYGITLYIVLCEFLLRGVAQWLTRKRGEKWVKELDYFYLAFGLVGILGSVNRLEQVSGRFSKVDILAPMVLVTAIVIRFIKTRADIAGGTRWTLNNPHYHLGVGNFISSRGLDVYCFPSLLDTNLSWVSSNP